VLIPSLILSGGLRCATTTGYYLAALQLQVISTALGSVTRPVTSHLREEIAKLHRIRRWDLALVIYTKPGCPYCQQARDYYDSKGIPFTDYDAQTNRAYRVEMLALSGGDPTVPCIVENGKYKGSGWGDPPRG